MLVNLELNSAIERGLLLSLRSRKNSHTGCDFFLPAFLIHGEYAVITIAGKITTYRSFRLNSYVSIQNHPADRRVESFAVGGQFAGGSSK